MTANETVQPITVSALNERLSRAVAAAPGVRRVWLVAETSDLRVSTHCYMELVEKDAAGRNVSRIRANCWRNVWQSLSARFRAVTGSDLVSGMRVLMCVSAAYHPAYGMSVTIEDVDPSYTVGDAVRRRNEILSRLKAEGLFDLNKKIPLTIAPQRVAIISAAGAAGYGDFLKQLHGNPFGIRFATKLFPAVMQGDGTSAAVCAAIAAVESEAADWDCVVIIRGGGATSDLAAFDDYTLGARIARCTLPVLVGIGHDRDVTVPDFVCHTPAKTPTAVAAFLVERCKALLDSLGRAALRVSEAVTARIAADRLLLATVASTLPGMMLGNLGDENRRLSNMSGLITARLNALITPCRGTLDRLGSTLSAVTGSTLAMQKQTLDGIEQLVQALSPEAVLKRGFSITYTDDGHVLNASNAINGATIRTRLADGTVTSQISNIDNDKTDADLSK